MYIKQYVHTDGHPARCSDSPTQHACRVGSNATCHPKHTDRSVTHKLPALPTAIRQLHRRRVRPAQVRPPSEPKRQRCRSQFGGCAVSPAIADGTREWAFHWADAIHEPEQRQLHGLTPDRAAWRGHFAHKFAQPQGHFCANTRETPINLCFYI